MSRFEVPFIRPELPSGDELAADLAQIQQANWYTNFGPFERRFRASLEKRLGLAVTTFSNATSALMGALRLLLPDDRRGLVLVASFTFAAGPAAVQWAGHTPLFIDIDRHTLQPSLPSARRALAAYGDDIVGVLLTNTFGIGHPAMSDWEAWASAHGLPLIIDSAAGFGSLYDDGRPVGVAGDCEIFSFHATKPFAIGEGGAVATRSPDVARRLAEFSNFGFSGSAGAVGLGMNGKLQELNAAIGVRQLVRYDDVLRRRRQALAALRNGLEPAGFVFPAAIELSSVCFATVLVPPGADREQLMQRLAERGVESRAYYTPAVHLQPQFAAAPVADLLEGTCHIASRVLSLPVHASMAADVIQRIIDTVVLAPLEVV